MERVKGGKEREGQEKEFREWERDEVLHFFTLLKVMVLKRKRWRGCDEVRLLNLGSG